MNMKNQYVSIFYNGYGLLPLLFQYLKYFFRVFKKYTHHGSCFHYSVVV